MTQAQKSMMSQNNFSCC